MILIKDHLQFLLNLREISLSGVQLFLDIKNLVFDIDILKEQFCLSILWFLIDQ